MPHPDLNDRQTLVTGGAGFIGSHLVDALLERGARVRVLDDLSTGRRENLADVLAHGLTHGPVHGLTPGAERVELLEDDLRDPVACHRACAGVAYVFHQGALGSVPRSMEDPATTIAVNVSGTANLFAAARDAGVRRVVYASSSSVYGDSDALPKREGEEGRPLSPYALSKVMDEELAEVFSGCFGMEIVGLRYFNVYGPRQDPSGPYAAVIPRFFQAALAGVSPTIHGDGLQSRDFTYVADAVEANLLAAGAPAEACGRAYNVAGGRSETVLDLAAAIRELVPGAPEPNHGPPRPGDVRHSRADTTRAREALGFTADVELPDGLRRSLQHYRATVGPRPAAG